MRTHLLSGLFFVLGLAACQAPPAQLHGAVVDALSGAPIADATVSDGHVSATTDERGRFRLAAATGPLSASAPGYLDLLRLDVTPDADEPFALWPSEPDDHAVDAYLTRLEAARSVRDDPNDPALSRRARALLLGEPLPAIGDEGSDVAATRQALEAPPTSIRVWRRSIDGASQSCSGRVDVIPFEEYVAGVLPHEWIPSWHDESLRAGALAIRTYAWNWIRSGGKYDCADLDDTARSQVYRDGRMERATAAVYDTMGMAITVDGELASGEYSAENGDPTAYGVMEPLCVGFEIRGHRRGMCQWGSQRWALDGRDHRWIASHYFPGSVLEGGAAAVGDYDASFSSVEAPASMVSGERATVTFELRNTGRREWTAEATRLVVVDATPSPFFDDVSWIDDVTPTGPDAYRYAPDADGRFSFFVTAPEVADDQVFEERLSLTHEGFGAFGPEVTLSIRVTPAGGPPPPPEGLDGGGSDGGAADAGAGSGGALSSGCSASRPAAPGAPWALWFTLALGLGLSRRVWP